MSAWDARSGAVSATFKNCLATTQGVVSVDGRPARSSRPVSSALIAAQRDKPFVNVWHWGKDQVQLKCATPEKVLALAVTSDGGFLCAGTPSGKIYAWEVRASVVRWGTAGGSDCVWPWVQLASGAQIGSWFAHYKAVTSLAIMQGDSVLLSGGEDSACHAWNLPGYAHVCSEGGSVHPRLWFPLSQSD
jgi:WD40 repeat protein